MTIDTQRLRELAQSLVTQGAPKWEIEWAANEYKSLCHQLEARLAGRGYE